MNYLNLEQVIQTLQKDREKTALSASKYREMQTRLTPECQQILQKVIQRYESLEMDIKECVQELVPKRS